MKAKVNNNCFFYKKGSNLFPQLSKEIPIMITVLINVFIFISVVSMVGSKVRGLSRKFIRLSRICSSTDKAIF